jgi:hypothetical protein
MNPTQGGTPIDSTIIQDLSMSNTQFSQGRRLQYSEILASTPIAHQPAHQPVHQPATSLSHCFTQSMHPNLPLGSTVDHMNINSLASYPVQQVGYVPLPELEIQRIALKMKDFMISEFESIIDDKVRDRTSELEDQLKKVTFENKQLLAKVEQLADKVDDLEQYSRRKCLRISNYVEPEKDQPEDTDSIAIKVAEQAGVAITAGDIDVSHRVGKFSDSRPRDIIVKFYSTKIRNAVIKGRKVLRNIKATTYISEDLTKTRNELFFECRQLAKNKDCDIDKAWTYNGKVYAKLKNAKNGFRVYSLEDLNAYRPVLSDIE